MAEQRRRRRSRQRRSYQPALPREIRDAMGGSDPSDPGQNQTDYERLQQWKSRISRARRIRSDWEDEYAVEELERHFLGKHTLTGTDAARCDLWLNHFAATVQTQRPALLPTALTFLVHPKPGQSQQSAMLAKVQGSVLDTIAAQDGHLMKSLRLAMTQAFFRLGVLKVTYDPRMQDNPRAGEPLLGDDDQALVGGSGEQLTEPDQLLTDEVYRWHWVNATHMLLPDEGPDTTRWSWIGEEIEVPLEDAKEDTRFPKAKREALKANGTLKDPQVMERTTDHQEEDKDRQMFRYVECWDMAKKRLYAWADGQSFDDFLLNEDYPEGVEDHPYALLIPIPIIAPEPGPWPKPLVYDWLPIQREYNILRGQMINAGKRAARKVYYDEATFPDVDEAQKALESPKDMEAVKVNDVARPPIMLTDPPLNVDVSRNIPFLLSDWQRVTGASGTRLGDPDSGTATEAVIGEQNAAVRDSELRTMVLEWLTEAGKKMLQLVKQTLTLDLWVQLKDIGDKDLQEFLQSPGLQAYLALRLGGPQFVPQFLQMLSIVPGMVEVLKERFGQLKPLRVTRSQLQFETDVTVRPSTIRPVYRAQLLQLVGLLGPAALLSPTLLEELLASFELPQGEQITEELLANLHQQGGVAALQGRQQTAPGTPNPQSAASPIGTQNPLGAVSGIGAV